MKILVVDDEPEIREIIVMFLGFKFEAQFVEAGSGQEGQSLIKESGPFDLIVSDFNMPRGNGLSLFECRNQVTPNTPFILVTSDLLRDHPQFVNVPATGYAQKPFNEESLMKSVEGVLNEKSPQEQLEHSLVPISISTLERIGKISCPLYLRLPNGKVLKVLNANTQFDSNEKARFEQKGQSYLYVNKSDYAALTAQFRSEVLDGMVFTSLEKNTSSKFQTSASVQELLHTTIMTFGWSQEVEELAEKNLKIAQAALSTLSESSSELDRILNANNYQDQEFAPLHAALLGFFATALDKNYSFQNKHAAKILSLASYFHDLVLNDNQVRNEATFIKAFQAGSRLNKEDLEVVRAHPTRTVELLREWKNCPEEVLQIVELHHELPDGSGFPKGIDLSQMSELSLAFVILHAVVDLLMREKGKDRAREEFLKIHAFSQSKRALILRDRVAELLK